MVKKAVFYVVSSLFVVSALQGMENMLRDTKKQQDQQKNKIQKLEDKQKLIDFRDQYRSRHGVFAEEHNQGASTLSRKNGDSADKK